ncbi:sigma-70 family RNA polymerase sigma factor [Fusobacterium sp.]|uniref:sigma-70 family RNA polymerase sigma factor n=1 Tax=Fusobacterium sp. TaxID=68766 RepID=UPI002624462F|nr:sigma-70 family RNA polymerase sigma factor [Fusobacterium sp.]
MEEKDLVSLYLSDIRKYSILSREEEEELLQKVKEGDLEAKNKLIVCNLRLVISVAKNYMNKGMTLIDLISEGNFGLIRAIDKFDAERGFRFSTYAVWWIKQSISKALMSKGREIRIPSYKYDLLNKINKIVVEELMNSGDYPSNELIGEKLNISPEKIGNILIEFQEVMSLNESVGDNIYLEDVVLNESSENLENKIINEIHREKIYEMLDDLEEREKGILVRRYGLNGFEIHTLEQVGEAFNITRERVRQIEKKTLEKLRKKYDKEVNNIAYTK